MPTSFFQLFVQAATELNDPELITFDEDFPRQLSELCLNLILMRLTPLKRQAILAFPYDFLPFVDFLPIVDIYKLTPQPDILLPISLRDASGRELLRSNLGNQNYFLDPWKRSSRLEPGEFYLIGTNLLGVRAVPEATTDLTLTYVPYIEVINLDDIFPLDPSYESAYVDLLRSFLHLRLSQFKTAEVNLERSHAQR